MGMTRVNAYNPGDTFSGNHLGAGFITGSTKSVFFTIPLGKVVNGSLSFTAATLTLRQNGGYPANVMDVKSKASIGTDGRVAINNLTLSNATNNDACGVEFSYTISVS